MYYKIEKNNLFINYVQKNILIRLGVFFKIIKISIKKQ